MIFSFSSTPHHLEWILDFEGDVFCFFLPNSSVHCPEGRVLNCLLSSLRLKKPVLVLKSPLSAIPEINSSKRWDSGLDWIWVAPRALSHIADNYHQDSLDFVLFQTFLATSK